MNRELTQAEFSTADNNVIANLRAAKRGTPEQKAAAESVRTEWEAANALPQATAQQRTDRRVAIAAVAVRCGLVQS